MSTWRELTFPTNALKETVIVIEDDRANILSARKRRSVRHQIRILRDPHTD